MKNTLLHASFWFLYIAWTQWQILIEQPKNVYFFTNIIGYLIFVLVVYLFAYFILPRFFKTKKYLPLIVFSAITWLLCITVIFILEIKIRPIIYNEVEPQVSFISALNNLTWYFLKYLVFGIVIYYHNEKLSSERQLRLQQKALHEKERLEFENAALRAKINPHFIYNALGSFQEKVEKNHPETARNILHLSRLLRYTIQGEGENGLAPLAHELHNIRSLIELQQYQFDGLLKIDYREEGPINGSLPAQTLLTLVENAMKYGELENENYPLQIHVQVADGKLNFTLRNQKHANPLEKGTGMGMDFVRNRLKQVYGNQFLLKIDHTPTTYSLHLQIPVS